MNPLPCNSIQGSPGAARKRLLLVLVGAFPPFATIIAGFASSLCVYSRVCCSRVMSELDLRNEPICEAIYGIPVILCLLIKANFGHQYLPSVGPPNSEVILGAVNPRSRRLMLFSRSLYVFRYVDRIHSV